MVSASPLRFLCRDCLADQEAGSLTRCPACGSPRLISHAERNELSIAHMDCDSFYASIEKRDNPALTDLPVIIGGGRRGVVSTCCYVARTYGVRSAMPMFKALELCPKATVLPPDMEKYARVGRQIRALMLELTPLVEPISIDEAFLDLSGTRKLHGSPPVVTLAKLQRNIERDIGITISVGLSHNKFLAKIASDLEKPRGFSIIGIAETEAFLRSKPVGLIWGVGKVMQERLNKDGIRLIADLLRYEESDLFRRYGSEGGRLYRLARGIDNRVISPDRETKSISAETTFDTDISTLEALEPVVWRLCERVADRLRKAELSGSTVTLKLKTNQFQTRTRARATAPTQLAVRLFELGMDLLRREPSNVKYRLIGIGIADFHTASEADRGDLIDTKIRRVAKAADAIGRLRDKFGKAAVQRGMVVKKSPKRTD